MGTSNTWYGTAYPSSYTIKYTTSTGRNYYYDVPAKPIRRCEEPELETGDTSTLDDFLGEFGSAKE